MEHHFIVVFNTETNTYSIDYDSTDARFDDGTIYDPTTCEWSRAYFATETYETDVAVSDRLALLLEAHNEAGARSTQTPQGA